MNFSASPSPLSNCIGQRPRSRLVGAVEQVEADRGIGLLERPASGWPWRPSLCLRRGGVRTARAARPSGRRPPSPAAPARVCSAATVAYSELTTSMPASDPAVASSTTSPVPSVDQPIARAQRPPLARRRAVAANAEGGQIVVQLDLQPIGRAGPSRRRADRPAHCGPASRPAPESARPGSALSPLATAPDDPPAYIGLKPAGRRGPAQGQGKRTDHATILTSRSGTTITLRGAPPAKLRSGPWARRAPAPRPPRGSARAARSSSRAACR